MKHTTKLFFVLLLFGVQIQAQAQHVGILRKNYISSYFDTVLNTQVDVLDSSTIRLGAINPATGQVSPMGNSEWNMGINLTGATINPYANYYHISSGSNMLTFDMGTGNLVQNSPITGPLATAAFQNYRFNPSDTTIYGLVPQNFYTTVFDSLTMSTYQVLDSSWIRFGRIDPQSGQYALIGNTPYKNVYTLAGNAINPHQMLFHYSAVDTLVSIDLYTGNVYSEVPIQLPAYSFFENFTYSCADSAIYGIVRRNYVSSVYDSLLMQFVDVIDSTTFKLGRIHPTTGQVTLLSANNLGLSATLNGSCFIDPDSMTYYFSTGANIIGVSLLSGNIVSNVPKAFPGADMYLDMMRSTKNCFGASKVRVNQPTIVPEIAQAKAMTLVPNPATEWVQVMPEPSFAYARVMSVSGTPMFQSNSPRIATSSLAPGMYIVHVYDKQGGHTVLRLVKM